MANAGSREQPRPGLAQDQSRLQHFREAEVPEHDANELTHFDASGRARMVNVGSKDETVRTAVATGRVEMLPETVQLVREGRAAKGDVLAVAQVAAIMGAKLSACAAASVTPL